MSLNSQYAPIRKRLNSRSKGIALVGLSTITWGSGGLFVRLLPYDPLTVVFWRGLFASVFLGIFLLLYSGEKFRTFRHADQNDLVIAICSAVGITLFPAAAQQTAVANVYVILGTLPLFAAAFAWLWIGERPSISIVLASGLALLGIIVMIGPVGGPKLGDLLAILATAAQAVMTVAIRRKPDAHVLSLAWVSIVLSVLFALPFAQSANELTSNEYMIAAGFGLIPMTCGMTLYMRGSTLIPAALAALIGTLEAPIGALWAWVGVGEIPSVATFVGGSIVITSVMGHLLWDQLKA